jgi:hypothetical protein
MHLVDAVGVAHRVLELLGDPEQGHHQADRSADLVRPRRLMMPRDDLTYRLGSDR